MNGKQGAAVMADVDDFAILLEQLTGQLRCAHQREVDALKAKINHVNLKFNRSTEASSNSSAEVLIKGVYSVVPDKKPAIDIQQQQQCFHKCRHNNNNNNNKRNWKK